MWTEVEEIAAAIREGKTSWEELALDDIETRLKWVGLFHRRKRTPGKFMMRLKVSAASQVLFATHFNRRCQPAHLPPPSLPRAAGAQRRAHL